MDQIGKGIQGFRRGYCAFLKRPETMVAVFSATVIHCGLDILQHYLLFQALHVQVPFWMIFVTTATINVASIFAMTPGGSGLVEGMNFAIYAGLSDLPNQIVLSETILFRAMDAWLLWIGSGIATSIAGSSLAALQQPRSQGQSQLSG